MAHFQVIFKDSVHGIHINHFDEYKDAQEYWDAYADTETCEAGELLDLDDGEVIWEFGEEFQSHLTGPGVDC